MTLPLYSTIIDRRDGARCAFHRWFTVKRNGRKYKRARVAVLNMPCAERWRSIPERFVEPVLTKETRRKKRRMAKVYIDIGEPRILAPRTMVEMGIVS